MVDLLSRHRLSKMLLMVHTLEIVAAGIIVDSTIQWCGPGFVLLSMMTIVQRHAMSCLVLDHVSRQGASDEVFPAWCLSRDRARRIFCVAAVVIGFVGFVQPIVYVTMHMALHSRDVTETNSILLPSLTAIFVLCDVPLLIFFLKKYQAYSTEGDCTSPKGGVSPVAV